jgi:CRP-like cAMP-binding protein
LHQSPFATLPLAVLQQLAQNCPVRSYGAGEVVLPQGSPINELSLLLQGEVELLSELPGGAWVAVGILTPGDCFGERVVHLEKVFADATVRARRDLRLMQMDAEGLAVLIDQYPHLMRELQGLIEIRQRAMAALRPAPAPA